MTNRHTFIGWFTFCIISLVFSGPALAQEETPHWGYEGEHGPTHWGEMDDDYALCAEGDAQSPIDLSAATHLDLPNIAFAYGETPLTLTNNGHTIQVNVTAGSEIHYDTRDYTLSQFHFHRPSEHTINGKAVPMELHLVHRAANGDYAVVGVLLTAGDAVNPVYAPIFENLPAEAETDNATDFTLALADLLPAETTFTTYAGSLTTPPCSEGVRWLVLNTPAALSKVQLLAFIRLYELNARPVQPLNGRDLLADSAG